MDNAVGSSSLLKSSTQFTKTSTASSSVRLLIKPLYIYTINYTFLFTHSDTHSTDFSWFLEQIFGNKLNLSERKLTHLRKAICFRWVVIRILNCVFKLWKVVIFCFLGWWWLIMKCTMILFVWVIWFPFVVELCIDG